MFRIFWIIVFFELIAWEHILSNEGLYTNYPKKKKIIYEGLSEDYEYLIFQKIAQFEREFSYLDIGGSQIRFSKTSNSHHDILKILLKDKNKKSSLLPGLEQEDFDVILNHDFSASEFAKLGDVEFFDVAVIFDPVEALGKDFEEKIIKCLQLAFIIFVEIPPKMEDLGSLKSQAYIQLEKILIDLGATLLQTELMEALGSKLYLISNPHKSLNSSNYVYGKNNKIFYQIEATYRKSIFKKNYLETNQIVESEFMPGLNLLTFLMLQGEKPSREHIKSEFLRLITQQHADIVPHNMIITKNELKLIDFQDWRNQEIKEFLPGIYCDPRLILKILKVLDSQDRFYIHSETINGFR